MGTKKGQRRKTARRAYKIRKPRRGEGWTRPPRMRRIDRYFDWIQSNIFFKRRVR